MLTFIAEQIEEASTPRYFLLKQDLEYDSGIASTSNTGEIKDTDFVIGTDDAAIEAMNFTDVIYGVTIYMNNDVES